LRTPLCGGARKKRLISLLILLLLWPAFASAACSPTQVCVATTGTAVSDGPFNFAGDGFSASGVFAFGASPNFQYDLWRPRVRPALLAFDSGWVL
jgi:hypothetical protein